jgi:hypothetical protein
MFSVQICQTLYLELKSSLMSASFQAWPGDLQTAASSTALLAVGMQTPLASERRESELLHEWRFTANQFVLAPSPLRLTATMFSQMNTCGHSPYITSSLTKGWVCHLQLLLALASEFILGPKLLSQILDFHFCRLLRLAGLRWRNSTQPPHGNPRWFNLGTDCIENTAS